MGRYDNQKFRDAPELVEICTHCKHADCVGTCPEYRKKMNELIGIVPPPPRQSQSKQRQSGVVRPGKMKYLKAFGEVHSLREWAEKYHLSYYTLYNRVFLRGMDPEKALTAKPAHGHRPAALLDVDGRKMTVAEWARESGTPSSTIYQRLLRGWIARDAIYGRESSD